MYFDKVRNASRPKRFRGKAGLSTGVAISVLALALAHMPAMAAPDESCGAVVNGQLVCDGAGSPYENGIHYSAQAPEPVQDLTIHLNDVAVTTSGDHIAGIEVGNTTGGAVTVSGTGTVVTNGSFSNGITAQASAGDVVVDVGDVTTHGYRSNGITASSNYQDDSGNVTVTAGTVTTYGEASYGIRSETQKSDITIHAAGVNAFGYGSKGVYASSNYGNATVEVGTVLTTGTGGAGLMVYSGGTSTVKADGVYTYGASPGDFLDAGGVKAVGTAVNIDVGNVQTKGDYSVGIYANTNHVVYDATVIPNITINAGTVGTAGFASDGIVAVNTSDVGATSVTAQSVTTRGDYAFGIYAAGFGDVTVQAGAVTTSGLVGKAIDVLTVEGNIDVSANSIRTSGTAGSGVDTINYSEAGTTTISVGELITTRDYAHGIHAEANGDITITTDKLLTNGFTAYGISAVSLNGDINVSAGSVVTRGDHASGIDTLSYAGRANISAATVVTEGDHSSGIYAASGGGITIHAGSVTTSGIYTVGIGALNFSTDDVTITAGTITTSGAGGAGLVETSYGGTVTIDVDKIVTTGGAYGPGTGTGADIGQHEGQLNAHFNEISTKGNYAAGLITNNGTGDQHIVVSKSITTEGNWAPGILFGHVIGTATIDLDGTLTTSGDNAVGISGLVQISDAHVNVAGSITTSGDNATGIDLVVQSFGRGPLAQYGETKSYIYDGTADIAANTITTSGSGANGIDVTAYHFGEYVDSPIVTNTVTIATGTVKVTGEGAKGIRADSIGTINVDAGNTSSTTSTAIDLAGDKFVSLNIRGATVSEAADAAIVSGGNITVSLAKTGGLNGAVNGIVLSAGILQDPDAEAPVYTSGSIGFTNAGLIQTGSDYGINVTRGAISLSNSGAITGAVKFADGNDTLTNSGDFNVSKDSDFGAGTDLFVNTGRVNILPSTTAAGNVTFLGLEHFENKGGLVDLRNGHAGDVFTLPGTYAATGDARLGLDVSASAGDKLVVSGQATGKTTLLLAGLKPSTAVLTKGQGPTLVQVGAGSTATFDLGNADIGLVHYGLKFNAQTNSYALQNEAGGAVYATLGLTEGVQSVWSGSADAWSSHLANLRGDDWGNGARPTGKGNVWVQTYGANSDHAGDTTGTAYEQSNAGTQIGSELRHTQTSVWGVTGGYAQSRLDFDGAVQKADMSALSVGVYASGSVKGFFVNVLAKYDHAQIKSSNSAAVYSESIDGNSYGLQAEIGRRFGSDTLAFEPLASLAWVHSSLDDLKIYGQTIAFDDSDGLTAKLGGRVSGKHQLKAGNSVVFTAGLAAVQTQSGDQGLTFTSGGVSQDISTKPDSSYGQATLAVAYRTTKGLVTYVEGNSDFGGGKTGTAIRAGARFSF